MKNYSLITSSYKKTKLYLHPYKLTPDPTVGQNNLQKGNNGYYMRVYPHSCVKITPLQADQWQRKLNIYKPPPSIILRAGANNRVDMCIDFGTELEAKLNLVVRSHSKSHHVFISFGESIPEAEGHGIPTTNPLSTVEWHINSKGINKYESAQRGFRFVRIQMEEVHSPVELISIYANAWFAFTQQRGDFQCDAPRFQRLWQTSVYTARLCTKPDEYWDGIKRDRVGWFGDARITQMTTDAVFAAPQPALKMLMRLPTDQWTMGIPGYSFAAIGMFHQLIFCYGTDMPEIKEIYKRIQILLRWIRKTQLNRDGFIVRKEGIQYFGRVAFVDWSPMPVGGKFEELSWLQCQHVEALWLIAQIAVWLGYNADAEKYSRFADALAYRIRKRFWRKKVGMVHTLNQTSRRWKPLVVLPLPVERDNEYRRLYFCCPPIGESMPSRHSQTLAVWAGLIQNASDKKIILRTLCSQKVSPLITAYFRYFEAVARAECGDPTGALKSMIEYLADQVEPNDSASLWEWHDPAVRDFRKWALGDWPKSLCHGWSSGLVPLTQRYLIGVVPVAPGFAKVRINPTAQISFSFEAAIPTPRGDIRVVRSSPSSPLRHVLPKGIERC